MREVPPKFIKKQDFFLIIVLLLAAGMVWLVYNFVKSQQKEGEFVTVIVRGEEKYSFPLSEDHREEIRQGNEVNLLVIKDGEAYIESSNCDNQHCVHHSPIHYAGETIVCLPHRIVIRIDGENSQFDAISE